MLTDITRVHPIRLPEDCNPAKLEACRAYARMLNTLDASHLEPWLDENVKYESQWVFDEIVGKEKYLKYIRGKLRTIHEKGPPVWAEIAYTNAFGAGPCVIIAQPEKDEWVATLLLEMNGDKISRMDMCFLPSPLECRRTGEAPGT